MPELEMTQQDRRVWELVVASYGGKLPFVGFKPCAVYDMALDCIRVIARDCSVTEIKAGPLLVLNEANYPNAGEMILAGFSVECARGYCTLKGLIKDGQVELHGVLNSLLRGPYLHDEANVEVARTALHRLETTSVQLS